MHTTSFLVTAIAAAVVYAQQLPATAPTDLLKELRTAPTVLDRYQILLTKDGQPLPPDEVRKQVVYDFNSQTPTNSSTSSPFGIATIQTLPILTNLGVSVAFGSFPPCTMGVPHIHPRATEFFTVIEGALDYNLRIETDLLSRNNSIGDITGTLNKYQGVAFPIGAVHNQQNLRCEEAVFVVSFSHDDPGITLTSTPMGQVEQLEGKDLELFRRQVSADVASSLEQCMEKCGIAKR